MPFELIEVPRPIGMNSDLNPYELPPTVWNNSVNIANTRGRNNKARGATPRYTGNVCPIDPMFCLSWNDGTDPTWLLASTDAIYKVNISDTYANYTDTVGFPSGYSASWAEGWTGDVFNGVGIMNNTIDPPLYTAPSNTMEELDNWPPNFKAKVVRPFKNRLIALNVDRNTGNGFEPSTVLWSSAADVGSVPSSWDITDPATGAGDNILSDSDGAIVDGKALGNSFIIYKEDSVWAMDFVGGAFVYSFRKLFSDEEGVLSRDCVVEFEGKHFVVGKSDIYVHDGTSKRSLASSRIADMIYGRLDDVFGKRIKCVADYSNKNIWVYFVPFGDYNEDGTTNPYPEATEAMVWNWESDSWSKRTLYNVAHIGVGIIVDASGDTWEDGGEVTWDEDTGLWDEGTDVNEKASLLIADGTNSQLLEAESGTLWDTTSLVATLEKKGVDFEDQRVWKKINAIYPKMDGDGVVDIYVGHEDPPGSGVTYEGPYSFSIGEDYKVNCRVHGRNIALRIVSTDDTQWSLTALGIEWKPTATRR